MLRTTETITEFWDGHSTAQNQAKCYQFELILLCTVSEICVQLFSFDCSFSDLEQQKFDWNQLRCFFFFSFFFPLKPQVPKVVEKVFFTTALPVAGNTGKPGSELDFLPPTSLLSLTVADLA